MQRLLLLAGALALAGCNDAAETEAVEGDDMAMAEPVAEIDPVVGAYSWTEDDGSEVVGHLEADGSAWMEVDGERVDDSTWARNESGQVCISWEGDEENEPGTECMTFGEVGPDGTLQITDAQGEVDTVTKIS